MTSAAPHDNPFRVDSFFVLRTPLMPFAEYERWAAGLKASASVSAGVADLEGVIDEDRKRLRAGLRELLLRPEIREALFIASPTLEHSVEQWLKNADSERGRGGELSIARYWQRMVRRCTPFGLFAGVSTGHFEDRAALELQPIKANRRCTRFDQGYLSKLVNSLGKSMALRRCSTLRVNSSLYRAGDRMRYTEYTVNGDGLRAYKLVAVEESPYLLATLERARGGATLETLTRALSEEAKVDPPEAEAFLHELIDAQILTLDLEPRITGPEPTEELTALLESCKETAGIARILRTACAVMRELDRSGIGIDPLLYRNMAKDLESLPVPLDLSKLWQVDMFKPPVRLALCQGVARAVEDCMALVCRIAPTPTADSLATFREKFRGRYGESWMPLMEVLDPDSGIGFPVGATSPGADAPLLAGFGIDRGVDATASGWSAREIFLFKRVQTILSSGAREWRLADDDLRELEEGGATRVVPDAAAMNLMLAAASPEAIERGEFRLVFDSCYGPSGARLLGRFCYGDPELEEKVQGHLRAEENYRPDAIYAELVHLPQGRSGNVIARPVMRSHEIPFLARSAVDGQNQVLLTDLLV